jgi:hypothetical protein
VIAVDTNVLIYANRAELPLHSTARTRLTELAEGALPWALPMVAAWAPLMTCPAHRPSVAIARWVTLQVGGQLNDQFRHDDHMICAPAATRLPIARPRHE